MREIKFRAWDGVAMYEPILADGKVFRSARDFEDYNYAPHDNVMRYTGLKDKNGKEIYEGDIARFTFDDDDSLGSTYDEIYIVEWNERNLQFEFSDNKYHPLGTHQGKHTIWTMSHMSYQTEVIGNIYEHPHLLDKE